MAGTIELKTDRLILRRHAPEDGRLLYENFGKDVKMYEFSGWNPYATLEMAENTVEEFIGNYEDEHFYGWAIEKDRELVGTIGAYDYVDSFDTDNIYLKTSSSSIEVGISVMRSRWKQGIASEALKCVLEYLTCDGCLQNEAIHQNEAIPQYKAIPQNEAIHGEGIDVVKAWCAAGNIGSQKLMENSGMKLVGIEKDALEIGGKKYDKLNYEYSRHNE